METMDEVEAYRRALTRERRAREEAERLLEVKAGELYAAKTRLSRLNEELERTVEERTHRLEEAHLKLRTLIKNLPFAVMVEDGQRRIALCNGEFCSLFGVPGDPDDLIGTDCTQTGEYVKGLFAEPEHFLERVEELLEQQEPFLGERIELADGRVLERAFIPVSSSGSMGHTWLYRDITEAEEAAQELEQARRVAESANEEKSKFLAMMSHELRTPLSVVVGAAELLDTMVTDSEQARLLRLLRGNADSILHQITELLEYAKLEAGETRVSEGVFDPVVLVEDVVESLGTIAIDKGLEIFADVDLALPLGVVGDAQRLRQLLVNLVMNAVKFTERGTISVRAKAVHADEDTTNIRYEVADTGPGIAPEEQAKIFGRFYRVEEARRVPGTGLGLSICSGLAEMMGGGISVESELGRGSTFVLECPHRVNATGPREEHRPTRNALAGLTLAVLGVSEANRGPVRRLFEGLGARVLMHPPGRLDSDWLDGLEVIDGLLYDPDGVMVAESVLTNVLRAHEQTTSVPWVRVYGMRPLDAAQRAVLGSAEQVGKPLRSSAVAAAVRRAVGRGEANALGSDALQSSVLSGPGRSLTVLLVEDDPDNRAVLEHQIHAMGLDVDIAVDGRMAIDKARRSTYALVITDIGMPVVDGFAFARAFRELEARFQRPRTPIIALSAHLQAQHVRRCEEAGIDTYLTKPCPVSVLRETIERWVPSKPAVLVVDDAPDLRAITGMRLSRAGVVDVAFASSGEEALEVMTTQPIGLVLLDMSLPGISGPETASRILARPAWRRVPIVGMSGDATTEGQQCARDAGCIDFLVKPVTERMLRTLLEQQGLARTAT